MVTFRVWKPNELNYFCTVHEIGRLEKSEEWKIWFYVLQVELWSPKEFTDKQPH